MHPAIDYTPTAEQWIQLTADPSSHSKHLIARNRGTRCAEDVFAPMTDREAKNRAVKILAKSIYRDLESQGFDEKQIVSLATELISEVTNKMARDGKTQQVA